MKKILVILLIILFNNKSFSDEKMILGQEIYDNKAMCGACHTLKASNSNGEIGPNLDVLKPKLTHIINAVTNGIGVMPPWDGILTSEEIEAVAYYVFISTNN